MELQGLKLCLNTLNENNINFHTLVMDRHVQIRKYMRVEHPKKKHYFDVFHVTCYITTKALPSCWHSSTLTARTPGEKIDKCRFNYRSL